MKNKLFLYYDNLSLRIYDVPLTMLNIILNQYYDYPPPHTHKM